MTPESRNVINRLLQHTSQQNGGVNPTRVFNVSPRIAQTIEQKIMQSNDFLKNINNVGVKEVKGSILGFGVPATITKRTKTADSMGSKRRPTDPTALEDRDYECFETEQDTIITWDKIDFWAHLPNFYELYRNHVMFAQARDRLLVAWHGQANANDTDPDTHTQLEDVNKGFFQFMIEENPANVLGWTGTAVAPIKIDADAADADFKSLDELTFYLRNDVLHRLYRKRNDLRIIMGDELVTHENGALLGSDEQVKPTERSALKLYLQSQEFGGTMRAESDEFPDRGIFLTEFGNLSRYFQKDTQRRKISEDDHEKKGIVEYNFVREDYVVEAAEGAACVHPDAIQFKDAAGDWAAASDTWTMAADE